jgi:hypothetical protein
VLPICLSLMLILLILALALAEQGREHMGFVAIFESENRQLEVTQAVLADMQGVLQGELQPDVVGMPVYPPGPNNGQRAWQGRQTVNPGTLHAVSLDTSVNGVFNASNSLTGSVNEPMPAPSGFPGPDDSYDTFVKSASGIIVPYEHTLVMAQAQDNGLPSSNWAAVYSAMPSLAIKAGGSFVANDLRSVSSYTGASGTESGVPASVAASVVQVNGALAGRVFSQGSVNVGNMAATQVLASGPSWDPSGEHAYQAPAVTTFFDQSLSQVFGSGLQAGLLASESTLSPPTLINLSQVNHMAIPPTGQIVEVCGGTVVAEYNPGVTTRPQTYNIGGATVQDLKDTDMTALFPYNVGPNKWSPTLRPVDLDSSGNFIVNGYSVSFGSGGSATWNGDFYLPPNTSLYLPGNLVVAGNLLLSDHTTLYVNGSANSLNPNPPPAISVKGNIYMDTLSTIEAGGDVTCNGRLDTRNSIGTNKGLSRALLASGNVAVGQGMTSTSDWTVAAPRAPDNSAGGALKVQPNPFNNDVFWCVAGPQSPPVMMLGNNNPNHNVYQSDISTFQAAMVAQKLNPYLVNASAGTPDPVNVYGALIVAGKGIHMGTTMVDTTPSGAFGLLYAQAGDVLLDAYTVDPTRVRTFVGAAWASGNVNLLGTNARYFPYYTQGWIHTPTADYFVGAKQYHRTAFGRWSTR